jgi:hypothetical protein
MPLVLRAYGPRGVVIAPTEKMHQGAYIKSYNPAAFGGLGDVEFTQDINEALVFQDDSEARDFLMQVPAERPLRADGRPNRPIRAFDIGKRYV